MDIQAEIMRMMQNLVCVGTIYEVDHSTGQVRVDINGRVTEWIQAPGLIGENFISSNHMRKGTQVVVAAPMGDPVNAVIVSVLYSAALPTTTSDGNIDRITWNDGTIVEYDSGAKHMTLKSTGDMTIDASGNIFIKAGGALHMDPATIHVFENGGGQ